MVAQETLIDTLRNSAHFRMAWECEPSDRRANVLGCTWFDGMSRLLALTVDPGVAWAAVSDGVKAVGWSRMQPSGRVAWLLSDRAVTGLLQHGLLPGAAGNLVHLWRRRQVVQGGTSNVSRYRKPKNGPRTK